MVAQSDFIENTSLDVDDLGLSASILSHPGSSTSETSSGRARELYKRSKRYFIGRQFVDAYTTIHPLISESSTLYRSVVENTTMRHNVWVLYIALLDGIIGLPEEELKAGFPKDTILSIRNAVWDCTIWDQVESAYNKDPSTSLVLNLSFLCLKHPKRPKLIESKVKSYLDLTTGPVTPDILKLRECYATGVLPACTKWTEAQKYIEETDFSSSQRDQLLIKLSRLKSEYDEMTNRKTKLRKKDKQHNTAEQRNLADPHVHNPDKAPKEIPVPSLPTFEQDMLAWLRFVLLFARTSLGKPTTYMLITVIALISFQSSRRRLKQAMTDLLEKAKITIAMAARVRYL
ncbi:uncharacterized protein V1516DRAFT_670164 [Lipomyces oligophaga]|uniref:uncharacterized protein n=1 Tax=Lipomyces oligophaga TaxID=45792 RepID=UPI0034CEBB79